MTQTPSPADGHLRSVRWSVPSSVREDIFAALLRPRLWTSLAWHDTKVRFERSHLGPFWMTLQAAAWVLAIVFVFGGVLGPYREYAVYVAIGIVLYNFVTIIVTDSSDIFIRNRIVIHAYSTPYFAFVLKQTVLALIQLAFQSLVIVCVLVITGFGLTPTAFLAVGGLFLCVCMSLAIALLFSLLGLRFGDFRFAMLAIMRLGLFVTPIFWTEEGGGWLKRLAAKLNPIAHFIDLVRLPLMGQVPPSVSYTVAIVCIGVCALSGLFLFRKLRPIVPMWV